MRPLQIEMTNFGPYRNEVINFDQLTQDPVFLISGDTGSGKSMIFDAMIVALFYSTASDRDVKSLRSSFASIEDPETEITFYFEHSDHVYCIHRVIEQEVKKLRGKGTKKKAQEVQLTLVSQPGGEVLDQIASGPNNVGSAINDLLQMNAEQFKQIILLPQNKFSEFLRANTKDKVPILRTIFGTQIFDQFMVKLADLQKQVSDSRKERNTEFSLLYQDKLWVNVAEQLEQTPENEKILVIENLLKSNQSTLSELDKVYQTYQKQIEQEEKALRQAQSVNQQFKQLHLQEENYEKEILDKADLYKEHQALRQRFEFAKGLQDLVQNLDRSKQELQDDKIRLERLQADFDETSKAKDGLIHEKHLLDERGDELVELPSEIKQWHLDREQARQMFSLKRQLEDKEVVLGQLSKEQVLAQEKLETNKVALEQLTAQDLSEKDLLQKENQLHHFEDFYLNRILPLSKDIDDQEKELQTLSDKVKHLKVGLIELNESISRQSLNLDAKKSDRRALMVAQLRQELVDGEACVVCGSKDHPFADETVEADEKALKTLLEEVESLELTLAKSQSELSQEEAFLEHQEQLLTDKTKEDKKSKAELHQLLENFKAELEGSLFEVKLEDKLDAVKLEGLLKELTVTLSNQRQEFDKIQIEKERLEDFINHQGQAVGEIEAQLKTEEALKEKIASDIETILIKIPTLEKVEFYDKRIKNGEKLLADYQHDLEHYQQVEHDISLKEREIVTQRKEVHDHFEAVQVNLSGFENSLKEQLADTKALTHDETELLTWLGQLSQLDQVIASISAYETTKSNLEKAIKELRTSLENESEQDLTSLEADLEKKNKEQEERLVEKTARLQELQQQKARYQQLKDLLDEEVEARDEIAAIDDLANIVKGNASGQVRLNLVTYVLREYLQEVIQYANNRFYKELTGGRYLLELHDVEGSGNGQVGLDIDVRDTATDVSRSVSTLSGGETFVTALAIALSLSEIVQSKTNGATIEALFVDEGFGTLDKEALDRAMTALEDVGQNKMVGVISHVEEMKSRIGQQLQVTKHTDGSSELAVHSFY